MVRVLVRVLLALQHCTLYTVSGTVNCMRKHMNSLPVAYDVFALVHTRHTSILL